MRDRTRRALQDMQDSASTAMRYRDEAPDGWLDDGLRMDAIVRRVELVGEAASRVPVEDRDQFPSIEWREIIGIRQHLVHGYDRIDFDILDGVLRHNLPRLVQRIEELLA